ncbi:MAG: SDR family oxidoreductase [Candidatus Neomarinimicrobiota bacterium]
MGVNNNSSNNNFEGKTAVVTGGTGILAGEIAAALAEGGANVAIIDIKPEIPISLADRFKAASGAVEVFIASVLDRNNLDKAADQILSRFKQVDILINGAGGNHPKATTNADQSFFDIPAEAFRFVTDLNLLGTVLPCQVFGKIFAAAGSGIILNISSMNALRPLTRIPAYSAAKAAVSNFTQWLAVHMAQEYSPNILVNAIAPGFFLTDQNRFLLTEKDTGELTARGRQIIAHTPQGRFGNPEDLVGAAIWLTSDAAKFVTGIVVPVDGGFSAFSGV